MHTDRDGHIREYQHERQTEEAENREKADWNGRWTERRSIERREHAVPVILVVVNVGRHDIPAQENAQAEHGWENNPKHQD